MTRKVEELQAKAVEAQKIIRELEELARENDFGFEMNYSGEMIFEDWQSSDCYGEGNSETFGVNADGSVWITSSC